jgi:hypothetical protein
MRIRMMLGVPLAAALLLTGGGQVAAAAETTTKVTSGWVAVSIGDRVDGLVRPETLTRQAPAGMTRRTAGIEPRRLAADAFSLTVRTLDRTGASASDLDVPSIRVTSLDDSEVSYWGAPGAIELPAGRYAVTATIATPRAGHEPSYSIITAPELRLDRDRAVTLDARTGHRVSVSTDSATARGGSYDVITYTKIGDCGCTQAFTMDFDPRFAEVYAATVPGARSDSYAFGQALRAEEPFLSLVAAGPEAFDVPVTWYPGSPMPELRAGLTAVREGGDVQGKLVLIDAAGGTTDEELRDRIAGVRAKGGRMVLVNTIAYGDADALPLPTLQGEGPTVRRFFDLVEARESTVELISASATAQRYELAYGVTGALTGPQVHRPATAELAAVPTTYHESGPPATTYASARQEFFGSTLGAIWSAPSRTPQQRTEYFTPGTWDLGSHPDHAALADTRTFTSGPNPPLAWNKAVSAPSFAGTMTTREGQRPWAWRDGDAFDVFLPMFADSAGRPRLPGAADTGEITLHRDGKLVGTAGTPRQARFPVTPGDARYRLSATAIRTEEWWPLSTKVSADWSFRSGSAAEGRPLPLLTVRFDPALSPANEAKGRQTKTFPGYAPDARELSIDVSADDGRTWQPAAVTASKGHFAVTVMNPAEGFVSLRARAAGRDGNSVELTVLRAYRISR